MAPKKYATPSFDVLRILKNLELKSLQPGSELSVELSGTVQGEPLLMGEPVDLPEHGCSMLCLVLRT